MERAEAATAEQKSGPAFTMVELNAPTDLQALEAFMSNGLASGGSPASRRRYTRRVDAGNVGALSPETEAYNEQYSAEFPPRPISAEQHIAFWENCPIPDHMIRKAMDTYEAWRRPKVEALTFKHPNKQNYSMLFTDLERWKEANPDATDVEIERVHRRLVDKYGEVLGIPKLPRVDMADIVRIALMCWYGEQLPKGEQQRLWNTRFRVAGEALAPGEVYRRFNATKWCPSIADE